MIPEGDKAIMDIGALGVTAGAFFQFLPSVTALASLVWVCIRIYETDTVQSLLGKQKD
jgi:TctA family transporter